MNDDLVEQLREGEVGLEYAAADRIEELEAALRWIVEKDQAIMRRADFHTDCKCHRCAMDNARKLFGVHV